MPLLSAQQPAFSTITITLWINAGLTPLCDTVPSLHNSHRHYVDSQHHGMQDDGHAAVRAPTLPVMAPGWATIAVAGDAML